MENQSIVLAIETSCDETAASIIRNGSEIISNVVSSQIESQTRFGGVVPEIASRHHVEKITLVIEKALKEC
ncbi:tRNA N6-adenosine threonylcarbamoyltransferase OS=Ureibacillus acetophenoni OX=614649 GN=tsaD PE=3 SV=1 [Ureibacillus acetophenoni]